MLKDFVEIRIWNVSEATVSGKLSVFCSKSHTSRVDSRYGMHVCNLHDNSVSSMFRVTSQCFDSCFIIEHDFLRRQSERFVYVYVTLATALLSMVMLLFQRFTSLNIYFYFSGKHCWFVYVDGVSETCLRIWGTGYNSIFRQLRYTF